jgi:hypothetical protein
MSAAHGQAGDGTAVGSCLGAVGLVDERDDVLAKLLAEERKRQLGVLRVAAVDHLVVRHGDDHRQRLAFGEQVVGDEARPPVDVPRRGQLSAAAQQVEDRVPPAAVVIRWRVHVDLALAVQHGRVIHVTRDGAMRYRLRVVVGGTITVHDDRAVARLIREPGERVAGIDDRDAVDEQLVDVEIGPERSDGESPHAVRPLGERDRGVPLADRQQHRSARQRHGASVRRLQTERDGAVVLDLRREQVRAERKEALRVALRVPVQIHVGLLGEGRSGETQTGERKDPGGLHGRRCYPLVRARTTSRGDLPARTPSSRG